MVSDIETVYRAAQSSDEKKQKTPILDKCMQYATESVHNSALKKTQKDQVISELYKIHIQCNVQRFTTGWKADNYNNRSIRFNQLYTALQLFGEQGKLRQPASDEFMELAIKQLGDLKEINDEQKQKAIRRLTA